MADSVDPNRMQAPREFKNLMHSLADKTPVRMREVRKLSQRIRSAGQYKAPKRRGK